MRSGRGGLSLLETVMAAMLFATISIALVSLWFNHYRLMALAQSRLVATYVCKELMEDQLAGSWSTLTSVPKGSQPPIRVRATINDAIRTVVYNWSVVVVDTPNTKDVTVQVFWKEGNIEHETHLETLLFTLY